MNISGMLDLTCDIISVAQTRSATGGVIDTESVLASGVPCAMRLLNGTELVKYGASNKDRLVRFYFDGTVSINNTNKILFNSEHYDVEDIYDAAGKGRLLHVDARFDPTPITSTGYDS